MLTQVNIGSKLNTPFTSSADIPSVVSLFLTGSITIAGLLCIYVIITSSYSIITSSSKGNTEQFSKSIKTLIFAFAGLLLIALAFPALTLIERMFFGSGNNPFTRPSF